MADLRRALILLAIGSIELPLSGAVATYIGADPPAQHSAVSVQRSNTSSVLSTSEGNLMEVVPISITRSENGPSINFTADYNSYDADGSKIALDTVMGYGWTHSYNVFLFSQSGNMFRFDGQGRVTKYALGPAGNYVTANGYFETLAKASSTTFTLTEKDQTVFTFVSAQSSPFPALGTVWQLTQIADRNGNITTLTYAGGNLTGIRDTYGRMTALSYTSQQKVASVIDPAQRVTTFQYDPTGHMLTGITDPNGNSIQYSYNALHQLTTKIDKAGRTFTYTYSGNEPTSVDDSAGASPATLSNAGNWATNSSILASNFTRTYTPATTTKTDGRGNSWQYKYDSNGYIIQVTAPDGSVTGYTYNPSTLQFASLTDANGDTTTYSTDSEGNLIGQTDALGHVTAHTYEPVFNMMTSTTDARGRMTTYTHDSHGNQIGATDPLGQTLKWTYDSHGNVLSSTDKNGNTTTNQYDASGNLIKKTDPLGNVTTMTYDAVGNLLSHTDANGHTTSYLHDGMDRVIVVTDPAGKTTQTSFDGEGNRLQVIDRNGRGTSFLHDLRQRLTKTTDAAGNSETYTYDGNDERSSLTNRNGHTTTYAYDVQDRLIKTTNALGNSTTNAYDPVGNKIAMTDANGHTTTYTYDKLKRHVTVTNAAGEMMQFEYDTGTLASCARPSRREVLRGTIAPTANCGATPGSNQITGQTDANGKVIYYKYDALGRRIELVRKIGSARDTVTQADAVIAYTYDPAGNLLTLTEPDGNTRTMTLDADNRVIKRVNAAGDTTTTTYDGVGNVLTVTAPNLNVTTQTYNVLDRLTQTSDSAGLVATYSYDPEGNLLSDGDGNGNTTSYTVDALNRPVTVTDSLGKITTTTYDPVGNAVQNKDRIGNVTTWAYDAINQRISTTDALGNMVQSQYDPAGNLSKRTDANSHVTQWAYDSVDRPVTETYADGTARSFTYDRVGNVLTRTDQVGRITHYIYNDLYLLAARTYPSSDSDSFTYDLSGRMLTALAGRTLTGERPSLLEFTWDGADRVTKAVQTITFPLPAVSKAISYSYNIPGRTRTITYPGGRVITEHTDARNRKDHIDDATSPTSIVQYNYDLGNRVTSRNYRNGTTAAFTYNTNNWTLNLQHSKPGPAGSTPIAGFSYGYDNEGDKQYEQKLNDLTHSESYGYDSTYRLVNYTVGTLQGTAVPVSAASTLTSYNLDPVGNWISKTTNGAAQTRVHNSTNELTQENLTPLSYDAKGNLLNDGTSTYAFDDENRLTQITQNASSALVGQNQYDALGRRITKNGGATIFFYAGARILEEDNALGNTQATYVYGNGLDEVLTMDRVVPGAASQPYYYHQNARGSVEAITNSTGTPVERYAYDAYGLASVTTGTGTAVPLNAGGTPHSAIGNPYMFTGRQLDEETGLYFYRARYEDPRQGRFISRDPIGMWGDPGNSGNGYAYAGDNPISHDDPLGLAYNGWTGPYNPGQEPGWTPAPWANDDACTQPDDAYFYDTDPSGPGNCLCAWRQYITSVTFYENGPNVYVPSPYAAPPSPWHGTPTDPNAPPGATVQDSCCGVSLTGVSNCVDLYNKCIVNGNLGGDCSTKRTRCEENNARLGNGPNGAVPPPPTTGLNSLGNSDTGHLPGPTDTFGGQVCLVKIYVFSQAELDALSDGGGGGGICYVLLGSDDDGGALRKVNQQMNNFHMNGDDVAPDARVSSEMDNYSGPSAQGDARVSSEMDNYSSSSGGPQAFQTTRRYNLHLVSYGRYGRWGGTR